MIITKKDDITKYYDLDTFINENNIIDLEYIYFDNNRKEKVDYFRIISKISVIDRLCSIFLIRCDIFKIPEELFYLTNLKSLNLSNNNITEISKSIKNFKKLNELYISKNNISELPEEIGHLSNLNILCLSNNKLKNIPNSIGKLKNLRYLYINDNLLNSIPSEITECTKLRYILYLPQSDHFYVAPHVRRFLNEYNSSNVKFKVYSDNENIHTSSIQESLKKSIMSLSNDVITKYMDVMDFIIDQNKEDVIKNCQNKTTFLNTFLRYEDILNFVIHRIDNSDHKEELIKRLNQEIYDSKNLCFVGKITRLVNTLCGFFDDIIIGISENEQIQNIILTCLRSENIDENFTQKMKERNYSDDIIKFYLQHIHDFLD